MTSISSIRALTLDLPPSCIAFCPTQPQYFLVGTYYLHPKAKGNEARDARQAEDAPEEGSSQRRSGSLLIFTLDGTVTTHVATEPTPDFSILDIQWTLHPATLGDLLAVATSTGTVVFYRLDTKGEMAQLVHVCSKQICEPSILVLSLAWHPNRPDVLGATLSDGSVCMVESTEASPWTEGSEFRVTTVYQHSLEAWWLALSTHSDGVTSDVFSGGDDMVLQHSTMTTDTEDSAVLWQDRRIHQAGVTAILPVAPDLILTGSYDDHIRLISAPYTGRRKILAEVSLSGGVWRLKVLKEGNAAQESASTPSASTALPSARDRSLIILASCMHAGTRVVRLMQSRQSREEDGKDDWGFEVLAKFEEHESMNYGSDVQPSEARVKMIVSTSFYDKLLCLWEFDIGCAEAEVAV